MYSFEEIEEIPTSEVVVIFGARVHGNKILSDALMDRADSAIDIYKAKKAKKIYVSGDTRSEFYNEVETTVHYLQKRGIPNIDILQDPGGLDTYDSLHRAKYTYNISSAILATQEFHLPRALFLCRSFDIKCSGVIADRHTYIKSKYFYARESLANIKAMYELIIDEIPTYSL